MKLDLYSNTAVLLLQPLDEAVTSADGTLTLDVSQYNGQGLLLLDALEDASIANSKKMDVTVHNVASDSETTDADNLIATFAQIVGENDGSAIAKTTQVLPINLGEIPKLATAEADTVKKYLQVKRVNTATWAGSLKVTLLVGGHRVEPVNAMP